MRHWILAVFIFAHCAANAAPVWEEQVHDGVTVYEYALEKPRTMKVFVTLERTGAVAQKINGELKFYGATALAAFREGTAAPLASTTLVDDHFSEGDTATATFSKDTNTFFKAEIGEK